MALKAGREKRNPDCPREKRLAKGASRTSRRLGTKTRARKQGRRR